VTACGKGGGTSASVELFGKTPTPPGELAKITADMTQAQFKAAFPKAHKTPRHEGSPSLTLDSGFSNLQYKVTFYDNRDQIADITIVMPKDLAKKLEKAWGPQTAKDAFDRPAWKNDEGGYTARFEDMGNSELVFTLFTPFSPAYVGNTPAPFDTFAKLKLGMTRDEVKAAGISVPPKEGGAYTPNEGKAEGVKVDVSFSYDKDTLERIDVRVPEERAPEVLTKAWGPGKQGKTMGDSKPCQVWETADKSMKIQLLPGGDLTFMPASNQGSCEA
jgi:hypothetical protein